ncbi:MAG: DEAD/DEAH box helicase [Puniceicoccaceae bacterium]|nr:MAG: DEAD/DEAH box helicase [Puniceicoccaceae bacterium]
MPARGPKRLYSPSALEFWFEKLELPWDPYFPEKDLNAGRGAYREGIIREVELSAGDAVVHAKLDAKEEYVVIEWSNSRLQVRSSSPDRSIGNQLAIAGLHEIEELVADSIDFLSGEPVAEAEPPALEGKNGTHVPAEPKHPARTLRVCLRAVEDGVLCEAFWENGAGEREPALDGRQGGTSAQERMQLITLAAQARKARFRFNPELGGYLLEDLSQVPVFMRETWPAWRKRFGAGGDGSMERLTRGVRPVEVEVKVRPTNRHHLDVEWIFRSGEKLLSPEEVRRLRSMGDRPLLLPDTGLVSLKPDHLQALTRWRQAIDQTANSSPPAYLLFSLFQTSGLGLQLSTAVEEWKNRLLQGPPEGDEELPEVLRPYQRTGVLWLAHLFENGCHGLLADEMGLGKTLQTLSLLTWRPVADKPSLVVCPASVVPVWEEEAGRHFPDLETQVLRGGSELPRPGRTVLWIASYAQVRRTIAALAEVSFGYVVLDEGQFIKNPEAKVSQACRLLRARHRLVLTGTPVENRPLDLWSLFSFLLPGLLGSRAGFEAAAQQDGPAFIQRLKVQLAPFILRRTKKAVASELPPKVETNLLCPLTETQKQEYVRICNEGLTRLGPDLRTAMRERAFGLLSLLTRLRQVACDPDLLPWRSCALEESGKLNLLVEKLVEVVEGGHKVVIFSQFVRLLKRVEMALEAACPGLPRFSLTGATVDRQAPVNAFQTCPEPAAMLVSLRAAGTGITLHAADYVFLLDPWWNPAVEAQAIDRVHRIGQRRTVFVYRMIAAGTVEERIQALQAEKQHLFRELVESAQASGEDRSPFATLADLIGLQGNGESEAENEAT